MIIRIDHVAIAVKDLEKARAFFVHGLGAKELFSAPFEPQRFRWTTLELGTSCFVELIDPIGDGGFVQRFIDTRGEGMHHLTIQVEDIQAWARELVSKGIPIFGLNESLPGWKEFFIHPRDAFGTLIQFAEFHPLDWIDPGYVPRSYQEFLPKGHAEDGEIEVRRYEGIEGTMVELRQAEATIRIRAKDLPELIRRVMEAGECPSSGPNKKSEKT